MKTNENLRQNTILDALTRAAEAGKACPSNADLAEMLPGCVAPNKASGIVRHLEKTGVITVRRFQMARVVTIVATGKSTAAPGNQTPHWRDGR